MRDTSLWAGNPLASKMAVAVELRRRHPGFHWYEPGGPYYSIPTLGETWGDSPGTFADIRERDLPTRFRYGGFAVMGDSIDLSGGNILRVTSLRAGNQGDTMLWKEITDPSSLTSMNTLAFTTPARAWTGIGVAQHSTYNMARLFAVRSSDNKLMYRDFTSGVGFGTTYQYTASPAFSYSGTAVAPITHDEGFVMEYSPSSYLVTLHRFAAGVWTSATMPMRYPQHHLNCHWFDAVAIGTTERLITFCVNGVQYATIYDAGGFRDPWPVIAFTAEYGGAQTRICKLTTVGSRVIATAWSRFAGSSDDYEVSYYHLMWTDDGVNWAIPEEGFIGPTASRGKLHVQGGDNAYILGASVAYFGHAVAWLGGTVGVTDISSQVVSHNLVQDLDQASDMKLELLVPDDFDHELLQAGNELVYRAGIHGETPIDIARLTMDTPGHLLDAAGQTLEVVGRGPLKKLISFTSPMDQTIDSAQAFHFDFKQGGLYARKGAWSTEPQGLAYCERTDTDGAALATIGIQYKGQFQISTRLRVTQAIDGCVVGIVFWYEGPQDYYRLIISPGSGGRAYLQRIEAGQATTLASVDVVPGIVADTWYHLVVRYAGGTLLGYIRGGGSGWDDFMTFAAWDRPEPTLWYAGLYCAIPSTTTTQTLDLNATHKVSVKSTTGFPASGEIKVDSEIIGYASKTATQFGSGSVHSLVRGVRSIRTSHPENAPVLVAGRRFEAAYFSIFQDDRPMSVADACAYLVTATGVPCQSLNLVDDTNTGVRVFPELHGHSWVLGGTYGGGGFSLYFWTDTNNPPQSGIKVQVTTGDGGRAILSDIVGGELDRQKVSIPWDGTFRCRVEKNTIILWVNDRFLCGFVVPGERTYRVGAVACDDGVHRLAADELFEAAEGLVWPMRESARDVLQRLLEGRDARLRERSDGSVQVTLLEQRDDLGSLTGQYFVTYQRAAADDQWASAMVAWGAEDWVLVMAPDADRLRWTQWQTPHIYDRETLRKRAMHRLRKLWALKDLRACKGPFDPRLEVGDELTIAAIRGIPAGRYLVRGVEIVGDAKLLDMNVTVQALPDELTVATWPILPGVDRPSAGAP